MKTKLESIYMTLEVACKANMIGVVDRLQTELKKEVTRKLAVRQKGNYAKSRNTSRLVGRT